MAILTDTDRAEVWSHVMRVLSDAHEPCGVTKQDLRAAINAVDQWISDNQASFNTALPLPARTALTTAQKARLLKLVVAKRFIVGA